MQRGSPVDSSHNGNGTTSRHLQNSIQRSTSAVLITLMAQLQMRLVIYDVLEVFYHMSSFQY